MFPVSSSIRTTFNPFNCSGVRRRNAKQWRNTDAPATAMATASAAVTPPPAAAAAAAAAPDQPASMIDDGTKANKNNRPMSVARLAPQKSSKRRKIVASPSSSSSLSSFTRFTEVASSTRMGTPTSPCHHHHQQQRYHQHQQRHPPPPPPRGKSIDSFHSSTGVAQGTPAILQAALTLLAGAGAAAAATAAAATTAAGTGAFYGRDVSRHHPRGHDKRGHGGHGNNGNGFGFGGTMIKRQSSSDDLSVGVPTEIFIEQKTVRRRHSFRNDAVQQRGTSDGTDGSRGHDRANAASDAAAASPPAPPAPPGGGVVDDDIDDAGRRRGGDADAFENLHRVNDEVDWIYKRMISNKQQQQQQQQQQATSSSPFPCSPFSSSPFPYYSPSPFRGHAEAGGEERMRKACVLTNNNNNKKKNWKGDTTKVSSDVRDVHDDEVSWIYRRMTANRRSPQHPRPSTDDSKKSEGDPTTARAKAVETRHLHEKMVALSIEGDDTSVSPTISPEDDTEIDDDMVGDDDAEVDFILRGMLSAMNK